MIAMFCTACADALPICITATRLPTSVEVETLLQHSEKGVRVLYPTERSLRENHSNETGNASMTPAVSIETQEQPASFTLQAKPLALRICNTDTTAVQETPGKPKALDTTQMNLTAARTLALTGIAFIPLDAMVMPEIDEATEHHDGGPISIVNSLGTPQVLLPIVGSLCLTHDPYDKASAKMAAVALVNAGVLVQVGKTLAGRERPNTDREHDGEFTGPSISSAYASFPSGHTAVAFAVATVLAHRYPKHRWLCYGLASAVGIARVWRSAHFPSDVLVGAGVGVFTGENAIRSNGQLLSFQW
ncbi:MAG TPA: phosphatase PAP2 family protein [Armatimonadota bacterium]|nr:phosphatase PAP2 family protein [Armatimonadota bacterium]